MKNLWRIVENIFLEQTGLTKKELVHFYQKKKGYRKNVTFYYVYKLRIIHIKKYQNSIKTYLYTELYTLSTGILCKLGQFIMVT